MSKPPDLRLAFSGLQPVRAVHPTTDDETESWGEIALFTPDGDRRVVRLDLTELLALAASAAEAARLVEKANRERPDPEEERARWKDDGLVGWTEREQERRS